MEVKRSLRWIEEGHYSVGKTCRTAHRCDSPLRSGNRDLTGELRNGMSLQWQVSIPLHPLLDSLVSGSTLIIRVPTLRFNERLLFTLAVAVTVLIMVLLAGSCFPGGPQAPDGLPLANTEAAARHIGCHDLVNCSTSQWQQIQGPWPCDRWRLDVEGPQTGVSCEGGQHCFEFLVLPGKLYSKVTEACTPLNHPGNALANYLLRLRFWPQIQPQGLDAVLWTGEGFQHWQHRARLDIEAKAKMK
mmetsp:Transcript_64577/g.154294  ORF Transcript_64577/g.154294 Transcript_64577/m.154294 type:complete len:244 (+) Transcript_64577:479-1210(+)